MKVFPRVWALSSIMTLCAALPGCLTGMGEGMGGNSSKLAPVHYYFVDAMARYDRDMKITPDGSVEIAERKGPLPTDIRRVTSHLSPAQESQLRTAFRDWDKLSRVYSSDFALLIDITYGDHQVQTSSMNRVPDTLKNAKNALDEIALEILGPATRPATSASAVISMPEK